MHLDYWQGRRVFVTGHTGFKGAWLCLLLQRLGAKVAGYALAPPTQPSLYQMAGVDERLDSTIADIRDLDRLTAAIGAFGPDIILHMAAQSVVLDSYADPVNTYSSNVMGTVHVLEAVRRLGSRLAVVNVTTDKVYENRGWPWGYREIDRLGGRDPYSSSKACSELATEAYRQSFFPLEHLDQHGVAIACARAGNVIGGGDWTPHQLIPSAVAAFARGDAVELRSPRAVRPWQHVLDCLTGYLMLAQRAAASPREFSGDWNFGPLSEDACTVAEVAESLASHWGLETAWRQAPGIHPHEEMELRLDCSKTRRLLGWRCQLSTAAAIAWVAEWYRHTQSGVTPRSVCEWQIEAYLALGSGGGAIQ